MKVPNCTYCNEPCEGQAFHISEQGGERRMRHICEKCLIRFFDVIKWLSDLKGEFVDGPIA